MQAKLLFTYENRQEAKAIAEAISPDNEITPIGLSVKATQTNQCIEAHVQCEKSLYTFISTIDDLLECIGVAENLVRITHKMLQKEVKER